MVTRILATLSASLFTLAALALLLLAAAPLFGADDPAVNRKVKAALAIAEAEAKGKQRSAAATGPSVAPAPRAIVPKDYATGHKESVVDQAVLVVYVACDGPKVDGAIVCVAKAETFGEVKGPAVVIGYPQGDRLYVERVLPAPADDDKLKAAVKEAGKKINGKGPARQMPQSPRPLDWQIKVNAPCPCGGECKCAAGSCPSKCPLAVKADPVLVGYQRVCQGNGTCRMVPVYR